MRKYETMYIIDPTVEEDAIQELVERFSNLVVNQGGEVDKIDEWGNRRLAYPIKDYKEGYYVVMNFSGGSDVPKELERVYKITDSVLRYLIIREDD